MKTRNLLLILTVALFFSGCVIWSFYPLYTEKDLFTNDILTGTWTDGDGLLWKFEHPVTKTQTSEKMDSTKYTLVFTDYDSMITTYEVNIIKLKGNYFLNFYLEEIGNKNDVKTTDFALWNLHILPVHTFAKLTMKQDTLQINWFDGDWLQKQIEGKKIKIRHEKNDESLLLTAKTDDLQKLVVKYANSPEAFKDGLEEKLVRK